MKLCRKCFELHQVSKKIFSKTNPRGFDIPFISVCRNNRKSRMNLHVDESNYNSMYYCNNLSTSPLQSYKSVPLNVVLQNKCQN